jgi:hypothetical protein
MKKIIKIYFIVDGFKKIDKKEKYNKKIKKINKNKK